MAVHRITKGLDLPISGAPEQQIHEAPAPSRAALLADDYVGMKPTMHVAAGDDVRRGQLLFEDKKTEGVRYTAPAGGRIAAVNRGDRRALQSVVIQLDSAELSGSDDCVSFESYTGRHPKELSSNQVRDLLVESGRWTALRQRPFSRVANPTGRPHSIFVTASDSNPLAPAPDVVFAGQAENFDRGLQALAKLTDGPVHVCKAQGSLIPVPNGGRFQSEEFAGPHPAGTAGLHIHKLDPVDRSKTVWHIGYQDVISIGKLFATGRLDVSRVISLAGPGVTRPRLLKTRIGASTTELTSREIHEGEQRVISGSVLSGRRAMGDIFGYLGAYHQQITVLPEGRQREFLGWLTPGADRFSIVNAYLSKLVPGKQFPFSTTTYGSDRAMVPIGMYEAVMPMDILPTFLLRALLVGDLERAEELGCLELDEEDLALCTFVCPGKSEYGPLLRQMLDQIEKEG
jgi:Na+-transporting NADH:ubiquinone oxidoreductase subunit A